jgi:hypothetical protein
VFEIAIWQTKVCCKSAGSLKEKTMPQEVYIEIPENLEIMEGFAHFSPCGQVSLEEGIALVSHAIGFCYERNIPKLLVDTTQLIGFPPPPIVERYWMAQDWAQKAKGRVTLSMVLKPEFIDAEKFGVIAAGNAGLRMDVFTSESEALEWLLRQK